MLEDELLKLRFKAGSLEALQRIYEKYRDYLEEIDRLRQQDIRRLSAVIDTETTAGWHRAFLYDYTPSNGRTVGMCEGEPGQTDGTQRTTAQWDELTQLRKAGPGQDAGTQEKLVKGHLFTFQRQRFVLDDGTEVIWSQGTPKNSQ